MDPLAGQWMPAARRLRDIVCLCTFVFSRFFLCYGFPFLKDNDRRFYLRDQFVIFPSCILFLHFSPRTLSSAGLVRAGQRRGAYAAEGPSWQAGTCFIISHISLSKNFEQGLRQLITPHCHRRAVYPSYLPTEKIASHSSLPPPVGLAEWTTRRRSLYGEPSFWLPGQSAFPSVLAAWEGGLLPASAAANCSPEGGG